jgi:hypothetical protein
LRPITHGRDKRDGQIPRTVQIGDVIKRCYGLAEHGQLAQPKTPHEFTLFYQEAMTKLEKEFAGLLVSDAWSHLKQCNAIKLSHHILYEEMY